MSDYYTTSEEEFVYIDNITSKEEEFNLLNSIEDEENNAIMLLSQEFKKMHDELSLLATAYKKQLENHYLNDEEWEVVDYVIKLLEPMLITTELLSSSLYPTISDIYLTFLGLLHYFNEYWSMLKESTMIATILDPSFKLIIFPFGDKDAAFTSLRNIMIHYKSQAPQTTTTTSTSKLTSKNKQKFFKSLLI
ncbi:19405_t:CDS:2 [Racocetra persica]|uniref:19405_t:CDS:1 n=1 Tax=Racocetra persica TaxID=160502 RepID=A0ACA9MFK6_9GLOM|nr:19405_t:CDS:2 [Racocetra persica]